jgi:glycosyltransferase involved in cell wall biosynthesis
MRILLVHPGPEFSVADVFDGWGKALQQLGHEIGVFNTNDRLSFLSQIELPDYSQPAYECGHHPRRRALTDDQAIYQAYEGLSHALYTFWPDLVVFVSAFYTRAATLQLVRSRNHKMVLLHTESPYQDEEQLLRAQFADLNLLNDPTNIKDYEDLGVPVEYMPHAYDPDKHYPRQGELDTEISSDFSFVGTVFPSRQEFFEEMFRLGAFNDMNLAFGGSGWGLERMDDSPLLQFLGHPRDQCVDNSETARVYRNSRAGINFYRRESEESHTGEGVSIGPREVEMAACGLPFLRDPRPETDQVFPFLPSYSSPEEAAEKLKWLLADENRRADLGLQAREAIKHRTFLNNAKQMMRLLTDRQILPRDKCMTW